MTDGLFDIIIVGGTSAGLTAAVYAVRRNLKTLVISSSYPPRTVRAFATSGINRHWWWLKRTDSNIPF
ncbi:MAG: FAD-dependent oxidoreductase [Candidatus Bathyarchaeia archaeon]